MRGRGEREGEGWGVCDQCQPTLLPMEGVTPGGSEDSEEGQRSAAQECVCGSNYCFPPVCVCVRFISQCLHHSVRDPISAPLTKMPIKLPTIKTKLNSYAPTKLLNSYTEGIIHSGKSEGGNGERITDLKLNATYNSFSVELNRRKSGFKWVGIFSHGVNGRVTARLWKPFGGALNISEQFRKYSRTHEVIASGVPTGFNMTVTIKKDFHIPHVLAHTHRKYTLPAHVHNIDSCK